VIVVDNGSRDDTFTVASRELASLTHGRLISEPVGGLSRARNTGWKESSGAYVAFIDDDAQAVPSWIDKALSIITEHTPDVFGGPIYPYYLCEKPAWFLDEYEIRKHQNHTGWMEKPSLSGSNLWIRRETLVEVGGFDEHLGQLPQEQRYGEDKAFVLTAKQKGKSTFYDLDLVVEHLVPVTKMTLLYFMYSRYKQARDWARAHSEDPRVREVSPAFVIDQINSAMEATGAALYRFQDATYRYPENQFIDDAVPYFVRLGRAVDRVRDTAHPITSVRDMRSRGDVLCMPDIMRLSIEVLKTSRLGAFVRRVAGFLRGRE